MNIHITDRYPQRIEWIFQKWWIWQGGAILPLSSLPSARADIRGGSPEGSAGGFAPLQACPELTVPIEEIKAFWNENKQENMKG